MEYIEDKVDVLLATYNTNILYLKKQIDSILFQTYRNIHLIISDDNSTDKQVIDILKEYEKKDKRVSVYFQEENLGYLKNFEFLLKASGAEYIAFADHDDIWYENKIEICMETLKEKNVDLVYSDCKQIDSEGKIISESYLKSKNMPIVNGKNSILAFSRHVAIGCSTVFTKKIKKQMLPFDETVMAHDWLNFYLASKQNGVACIHIPLFEYRLHGNNQFGGRSLKQNLSIWKKENGKGYKSYKKYRNERVIKKAYLDGSLMCLSYRDKLGLDKEKNEEEVINYYKELLDIKCFSFDFKKYNEYLDFRKSKRRALKEKMIFYFPIISYLVFLLR